VEIRNGLSSGPLELHPPRSLPENACRFRIENRVGLFRFRGLPPEVPTFPSSLVRFCFFFFNPFLVWGYAKSTPLLQLSGVSKVIF